MGNFLKSFALTIAVLFSSFNAQAEEEAKKENYGDVYEEIAEDGDLNRFANAIILSGMWKHINDGGNYTVFAPVDEVFEDMDPDLIAKLESEKNRKYLKRFVGMHIVKDTHYLVGNSTRTTRMETLSDDTIIVKRLGPDHFYLNGHKILSKDMHADGILYEVDGIAKDITFWEFKEPGEGERAPENLRLAE